MRALECDYIFTSSNQHPFVRSYSAHDNTNENSSPELGNAPYRIVGWTELHEKSNKNQTRGMNKYYSNCLDVFLHFLLVVEVIKLNRILDLWMTLDATYCDVQMIYGLAEIS